MQTLAAAGVGILSQQARSQFSTPKMVETLYHGEHWTALCQDNAYPSELVIKGKIDRASGNFEI